MYLTTYIHNLFHYVYLESIYECLLLIQICYLNLGGVVIGVPISNTTVHYPYNFYKIGVEVHWSLKVGSLTCCRDNQACIDQSVNIAANRGNTKVITCNIMIKQLLAVAYKL